LNLCRSVRVVVLCAVLITVFVAEGFAGVAARTAVDEGSQNIHRGMEPEHANRLDQIQDMLELVRLNTQFTWHRIGHVRILLVLVLAVLVMQLVLMIAWYRQSTGRGELGLPTDRTVPGIDAALSSESADFSGGNTPGGKPGLRWPRFELADREFYRKMTVQIVALAVFLGIVAGFIFFT